MIEEVEEQELLEKLHKDDEKPDFKSVLNKKKINKWEMDEAFLGET